jgi:hypothetical protein
MQGINYPNYFETGTFEVGLQGRYIFPVLIPAYALIAFYLMKGVQRQYLQWPVAGAIATYFIYAEFPWFLRWVPLDWFF